MKVQLPKIETPKFKTIDNLIAGCIFGFYKKESPMIPRYMYDTLNEDIYMLVEPQKQNMMTFVHLGNKFEMVHRLPSTMIYDINYVLDEVANDNGFGEAVTELNVRELKTLYPGNSFKLVNTIPGMIQPDSDIFMVITNPVADNKNITCLNLDEFSIHTFDPETIVFKSEAIIMLEEPKSTIFNPEVK